MIKTLIPDILTLILFLTNSDNIKMNDVISIVYIFRKITNDNILIRVKRMYCLYK